MTSPKPPDGLSADRVAFWRSVTSTYELESHHVELLALLCQTLDRAEQAEVEIQRHGVVVEGKYGPKANPACAIKSQAEALAARLLRELRLDEAIQPARMPRVG